MCNPTLEKTMCGIPLDAFKRAPTPSEVAVSFCELGDDGQAEFFVAVAMVMDSWQATGGSRTMQLFEIGNHLAECPNGDAGADIVREIHEAIEYRRANPVEQTT